MKYIWAIRCYDYGDEPALLYPDDRSEQAARDWHKSCLSSHQRFVERHPECTTPPPELVRAPLDWEVMAR